MGNMSSAAKSRAAQCLETSSITASEKHSNSVRERLNQMKQRLNQMKIIAPVACTKHSSMSCKPLIFSKPASTASVNLKSLFAVASHTTLPAHPTLLVRLVAIQFASSQTIDRVRGARRAALVRPAALSDSAQCLAKHLAREILRVEMPTIVIFQKNHDFRNT